MAMEYKQEELNLPETKTGKRWYTVREMADILGVTDQTVRSHLKKVDVTSHSKYIRTTNNVLALAFDKSVFEYISTETRQRKEIVLKHEVIPKYENEITRLKQEVQREKNKRTECLEKYSKHLDYIVSIKNEYSSMQRQIADLTAENNELKAELARKPVWRKLFA